MDMGQARFVNIYGSISDIYDAVSPICSEWSIVCTSDEIRKHERGHG